MYLRNNAVVSVTHLFKTSGNALFQARCGEKCFTLLVLHYRLGVGFGGGRKPKHPS